jgi:type II secretory pathway pseudopilin PulG
MTIVELLVVVTILGIVAALAAPRVLAGRGREVTRAARDIAHVLTAAGQRASAGPGPARVVYDAEKARLWVETLRQGEQGAAWMSDGLLPKANVDDVQFIEATTDSAAMGRTGFAIVFGQYEPRPLVRVVVGALEGRGSTTRTVELAPGALGAVVVGEDAAGLAGQSLDLDQLGQEEEVW